MGKECKHINCPGTWHVQNLTVKGIYIYISSAGRPFYHASIMLLLIISAAVSPFLIFNMCKCILCIAVDKSDGMVDDTSMSFAFFAVLTGLILMGLTLRNLCLMFVYVCFMFAK